jgi:hypothetical protein
MAELRRLGATGETRRVGEEGQKGPVVPNASIERGSDEGQAAGTAAILAAPKSGQDGRGPREQQGESAKRRHGGRRPRLLPPCLPEEPIRAGSRARRGRRQIPGRRQVLVAARRRGVTTGTRPMAAAPRSRNQGSKRDQGQEQASDEHGVAPSRSGNEDTRSSVRNWCRSWEQFLEVLSPKGSHKRCVPPPGHTTLGPFANSHDET